jgi:hypothetical protein
MLERLDTRALGGIPYWFFCFFLFPFFIQMSTIGSSGQTYEIWLEIGYHVLNFVLVLFFFLPHLRESFLMVQVRTKEVLKTAFFCGLTLALYKIVITYILTASGNTVWANAAFGSMITNESDLLFYSTAVLGFQPLWGTLWLSLLAPVTVSCLLYASVFATTCASRPWLAYPLMAGTILLIRLSMAFCLWPLEEEMAIYVVQLPVHMLACWSYQKTDTVWTPIFLHFFSNLVLAPFTLALMGIL